VWLDEAFTPRLGVAVLAILGGIALVLKDRARGSDKIGSPPSRG
jgi:hypothetical protein